MPATGNAFSETHKRNVNIAEFDSWLGEFFSFQAINDLQTNQVINQHNDAVQMIAAGADIWNKNHTSPALLRFRETFLHRYSALPTTTQFVE